MSQTQKLPNGQNSLSLFSDSSTEVVQNGVGLGRADLGTFKASLRAPIHRWFTYPAGFSYKGVEEAFKLYDIQPDHLIELRLLK